MLLDGVADGAEDDALLAELLLEGGLDAHGIHDGVDGGVAAEGQALFEGDAKLIEGLFDLGVDGSGISGHSGITRFLGSRVSIIADGLIVDGRHVDMGPFGLGLLLPIAEGLQPELEHPLGFALLGGDETDHVFIQALFYDFGMYVGGKAELVFLLGDATHKLIAVHIYDLLIFDFRFDGQNCHIVALLSIVDKAMDTFNHLLDNCGGVVLSFLH